MEDDIFHLQNDCFKEEVLRCGVVYLRTPTEQLQTTEQGSKTLICTSFTKLNIHLLLERVFLNLSGYSFTVTQMQANATKRLHKFPNRSHFSRDAKRIHEKRCYLHASSVVSTVTLVNMFLLANALICTAVQIYTNFSEKEICIQAFHELLLLSVYNVQFTFNNQTYRQKNRGAMGSPLGILLTDLFMTELETQKLHAPIVLSLVGRHLADDNITTTEVSIKRTLTGPYRTKYTWKSQCIHFDSFVPLQQKGNLFRCLTERAINICSSDCLQGELKYLGRTLLQNG
ncbi:hypothetical protein CSKR_111132 [Clonorchis sinensis]|uniref:Helix-turn-helix domain-containing protein n=1 Tax=Clonorchis sinensis TaxID=79923 RepID=A0A419Q3C7_CLOSI|nr:hypothetical protein CSKR_111132 [Clonorchis sinensis]